MLVIVTQQTFFLSDLDACLLLLQTKLNPYYNLLSLTDDTRHHNLHSPSVVHLLLANQLLHNLAALVDLGHIGVALQVSCYCYFTSWWEKSPKMLYYVLLYHITMISEIPIQLIML